MNPSHRQKVAVLQLEAEQCQCRQQGRETLTSLREGKQPYLPLCLSKCESVTNLICSLAFVCQTLKLTLEQKEGYSTISGTVKYLTSSIKMLFCIILSYFYSFTRCCFLSIYVCLIQTFHSYSPHKKFLPLMPFNRGSLQW